MLRCISGVMDGRPIDRSLLSAVAEVLDQFSNADNDSVSIGEMRKRKKAPLLGLRILPFVLLTLSKVPHQKIILMAA